MNKLLIFLLAVLLISSGQLTSQQLYVGANYHPHDNKDLQKIQRDIDLMKAAGFSVVRMGHLAWDSYEPAEGRFDFAWFDKVMDRMAEAHIKVILDIAIRPAPIWLHHKYPSVDITDSKGDVLYPNHRYMEDIGDPNYKRYALRYADSLSRHYAHHPALLAFGIDNESGDGLISYSESARQRFIVWLQKKYGTIDGLNKAWATQRWSRRINDFDEVGFPVATHSTDVPEKMLDFRRFVSDEINLLLLDVLKVVNTNAPQALTNTNAWYYSPLKYFDYATIAYSGKMTREGCGFYPGPSLTTNWGVMNALFGMERIQFESTNPFWCSEFTTMTAVPNSIRKSAYASLLYGNQMVCGWTWQSMQAGEEQYLEGMLDWDDKPNRKYDEYLKIASEFKKIESFFPYQSKAEIGLAFSFFSQIASSYFPEKHDEQLQACFNIFYWRNMDTRILDIGKSDLRYKLLFIPGLTVMDPLTANKIRNFVRNGGTVIMTSGSAMVDTNGQVFTGTRPGLLDDVFGIRLGGFEETENMNEVSRKGYQGKKLECTFKGKAILTESTRFDLMEPRGAVTLAYLTSLDKDYPIMTSNRFGKGEAIYLGLPARAEVLNPLVEELIDKLSIRKGPEVPVGVMAREITPSHFLFLNTTHEVKEIKLKGKLRSLLFEKSYIDGFQLAPFEPEFVEVK